MMKKLFSVVFVLGLACPALANSVDAARLMQQGLYLQHTLGDLDAALESYRRVLQSNPDPALEEQALLRLGECLEWAGQPGDVIEVVARLDKATAEQVDRLGPARNFPTGLHLVMQVDLKRMRDSKLMDLVGAELELDPQEIEQLVAALGLDPRKDLHRVSLGLELGSDERFPLRRLVVHLEGDLANLVDLPSILKLAKLAGGMGGDKGAAAELKNLKLEKKSVAGQTVQLMDLPVPEAPGGRLQLAMASLDERNLLLGMGGAVEDTLQARAGRSMGLRADESLKRMVERLSDAEDLWLMANPKRLLERVAELDKDFEIPEELPVLTGMLLSARFAEPLVMTASTWAEDKQSAQELSDLAKGGLALLRIVALAEKETPEAVRKLVRELELVTDEREVRLQARVPWSLLEEAAGAHQEFVKDVRLQMKVGERRSMKVEGVLRVSVKDPRVADVKPEGGDRFAIQAVAVGETEITAEDQKERIRHIVVRVVP